MCNGFPIFKENRKKIHPIVGKKDLNVNWCGGGGPFGKGKKSTESEEKESEASKTMVCQEVKIIMQGRKTKKSCSYKQIQKTTRSVQKKLFGRKGGTQRIKDREGEDVRRNDENYCKGGREGVDRKSSRKKV